METTTILDVASLKDSLLAAQGPEAAHEVLRRYDFNVPSLIENTGVEMTIKAILNSAQASKPEDVIIAINKTLKEAISGALDGYGNAGGHGCA